MIWAIVSNMIAIPAGPVFAARIEAVDVDVPFPFVFLFMMPDLDLESLTISMARATCFSMPEKLIHSSFDLYNCN